MKYTQGGTFTFGSDEGFEATHDSMQSYLNEPLLPNSKVTRGSFHTSFNLNEMTHYLGSLEFVMTYGALVINEARAAGDEESAQQAQNTLDWAERQYQDLAGIVGVELI